MACNITLADVTFSCDDLGIGGLKKVYLGNKADLASVVSVSNDVVTITPTTTGLDTDGDVVEVQFNLKSLR